MQVVFCLGLESTWDKVDMLNNSSGIARIGYQDDNYLVGPAAAQAAGWHQMEKALAEDGHRLRRAKCKAWTPGADHMDDHDLVQDLHALYQLVSRATGGLELLGGATQGELATHLGPHEKMLGPAKARAAKAMR